MVVSAATKRAESNTDQTHCTLSESPLEPGIEHADVRKEIASHMRGRSNLQNVYFEAVESKCKPNILDDCLFRYGIYYLVVVRGQPRHH